MTTTTDIPRAAEQLALEWPAALASGDVDRVSRLLAPDLRYRETTPEHVTEFSGARALLDTLTTHLSHVTMEVLAVDAERFRERVGLAYTMRVQTPDGPRAFRQYGWVDVADDQIAGLDLVCSGVGPTTD